MSKTPDYINAFPGYEYVNGKNMYRGEDVGRGGYVYSEPGCYSNVALLDIASMHPHSIIAMNMFGEYTPRFAELVQARIYIKHHEFDKVKELPNIGAQLAPFLTDEKSEDADALAKALKIAINSVYGQTAASYKNPFKDNRNVNNIVALRGALFMVNLKHEVQDRGFTVVHIKTDSIKIADATPEIISFCMEYAKPYGYTFEHEATYDRICLIDKAQYIAKYSDDISVNGKHAGEWTATGAAFQHPYIFKTLFSHEPIDFFDLCETKQVTNSAMYLDMNENLPDGEHNYIFVGRVGEFVPIKPGAGGGVLLRENGDKYDAVVGTKGRRWLESDIVNGIDEDRIDMDYFRTMVDDAKATIGQYDEFDNFIADGTYSPVPWEVS